ncbi:MAG: ATP-dependent Clp protease ATP-binding subunit [Bacteroidales bacterium]|nr:ATP-dependent Clp protease ATP-binding subunit [Bacteroidales bacterium]
MTIKISDSLNIIINFAREEAMRTGSYGIGPDHLLLGLIRHGENDACDALKSLEVDLQELKQFIDGRIFTNEHIPYSEFENISFSRASHNILSLTVLEASRVKSEQAEPVHLLLALARASGSYGQSYLRDIGVDYGRILGFLERSGMLRPSASKANQESHDDEESSDEEAQQQATISDNAEDPLKEFGYDITKAAEEGRLDPVVGRDDEIARVIQILGRRRKNNPMLIGEPGVGKSAIVEGIAIRIAEGRIPEALKGKRLISLDIASVVAGTRYRGDFEKRIKNIINQLSNDPDIILFIDEFHTMVGAGSASGSLDAANMLKPALARGDIQCIGATTMEEFRKIIEKDGALDRRFQKVVVEPADMEYSVRILQKLRKNYESHHGVVYTDEAIEACVKLSERYITDRCLPDKAIDAMDEAGSMVKLRKSRNKRASISVSANDVAAVISQMSGIPVGRIATGESERLLKMKDRLKSHIIGQDEAVDTVVTAIQRGRAGIKDPNRPIGSFLFFGPTGVGKTKLAKQIADYMFDSEDSMVRIDMSEYMEKFNVSRLVGAPPGYVGFDEGGQLSEQVKRKPYCVVLLDEIEKAHPDIFNLLLQVLDEGRLTDSNGRTVNFRNTIVIMTSNVGSRELEEYGKGVGFMTSGRNIAADRQGVLAKAVKKAFPPEFINRVDELVYFNSLSKADIAKIIDIELRELRERVSEAGFRISITPSAKNFVAEAGYDPNYGARPLKRAIQKYIENPVSEYIIADRMSSKITKGKPEGLRTIKIALSENKSTLELKVEV